MDSDVAFYAATLAAAVFFLLLAVALILLPLLGYSIRRTLRETLAEVRTLNSAIGALRKDLEGTR